jgi:hypothetical protein
VRRLASSVVALGFVLAGCGGTHEPAASHAVQRPLGLQVSGALDSAVTGVGDVDGDGHGDVVIGDEDHRRAWLFTSRDGALVPVVGHAETYGTLRAAEVSPLGDLDGDGQQDFALTTAHGTLVVLYGRRRWPRQVNVLATRQRDAAVITATAATGTPVTVARTGGSLVIATDCVSESCDKAPAVVTLPIPRRGTVVSLGEAAARPAPAVPATVGRLGGTIGFWVNGTPPVINWLLDLPGAEDRWTPLLQAGARTWHLGPRESLLGATSGAALAGTAADLPPGSSERSALKIYRLRPDGSTRSRVLVPEQELIAEGTLTTAGRCLVVSGWNANPPTVWLLDPDSLKTIARWSFNGSVRLVAQPMRNGRMLDVVALGRSGKLARASLAVPAGKC